jgi:phosphatidylglycerol---prolipoprotein diacylglyceryl transferase
VHPILIDFGYVDLPFFGSTHLFVPTYGVLFASAVVTAWAWFLRRARGLGLPEDRLFNLTFFSLLAGILGAKLLLVLIDWQQYLAHPAEILGTIRSAGVLLGGVAAGISTFAIYAWRHDLPLFRLGDAIAAPLALAQAVGRLGCFAGGCCWGIAVDPGRWFAVVFESETAHELTGVPLHDPRLAIQLIEAAFDIGLAALLTFLWRKRLEPEGTVFWLYALLYGVGRALLEEGRGDTQRGLWFGGALSTSQLLSVVLATVAIVMLLRGLVLRRNVRASSA